MGYMGAAGGVAGAADAGTGKTSPIFAVAHGLDDDILYLDTTPQQAVPPSSGSTQLPLWPQLSSVFITAVFVVYPAWYVNSHHRRGAP